MDLCKGNIILSHVDCFCLLEKKEDEARSILRSQLGDLMEKSFKIA